MKRYLLMITALLLLTGSAYARTDDDVKGVQFGIAYRFDMYNNLHSAQSSANLSLGYRLNRANYVGLQTGFAFAGRTSNSSGKYYYKGVPILADYIHYFPIGDRERHSIYAGAEAGWIYRRYPNGNAPGADKAVNQFAPFGGIKAGVDVSIIGLTHLMLGVQLNVIGIGATVGLTF